MQENKNDKKDKFYFSFSSITKLMRTPKKFYEEYILGHYDESVKRFLDVGSLVHQLVLEPEFFDEYFYVQNTAVPSDNTRDVINAVFKMQCEPYLEEGEGPAPEWDLRNYHDLILEELRERNLHQNLTDDQRQPKDREKMTGDEKRIEKIINQQTMLYFQSLIDGYGKIIVDQKMLEQAQEKANAILSNESCKKVLNAEPGEDIASEMDLKCDFSTYSYGLRGIIDRVKVDNKNKRITIVDLKTTSKSLLMWEKDFEDSEYMYWLQPIIYKELLLSLVPAKEIGDWTLRVFFLVIDKDNQVYPYPVRPESLARWEMQAKEVYDKAEWHMKNQEFDMPHDYLRGLVQL